jgi:Ca2+-binding RTX toxin-like protein
MSAVELSSGPGSGRLRRTLIALVAAAVAVCAGAASTASADPTTGNPNNPGTITIPAGAPTTTTGPADPFPSTIDVSGLYPNITKVTVTFNSLSHTFPDDIDALLVGPGNQNLILMSDAGGSTDVNNVSLTFDDAAAAPLPDATPITSGTYRPSNFGATPDTFPAPAPGPPYGSALSVFNGTNPNGTWRLYIFDDAGGDVGQLVGWTLHITAAPNPGRCANTFTLTNGDDTFTGGPGGDRIFGLGGNDNLSGLAAGDCLSGGSGNDQLSGGTSGDRVSGNSGNDRVFGNSGGDRLSGGSGRDRLSGGSGRDRMSGNSGRDRLSGGSGNDRISGNSGNDRLFAGSGNNVLSGGSGNDRLNTVNNRRDRANCGSGRHDRIRADRIDRVRNCEIVVRL